MELLKDVFKSTMYDLINILFGLNWTSFFIFLVRHSLIAEAHEMGRQNDEFKTEGNKRRAEARKNEMWKGRIQRRRKDNKCNENAE